MAISEQIVAALTVFEKQSCAAGYALALKSQRNRRRLDKARADLISAIETELAKVKSS